MKRMRILRWSSLVLLGVTLSTSGALMSEELTASDADARSGDGQAPAQVFSDRNVRQAPPPIMRFRGGERPAGESDAASGDGDPGAPSGDGRVLILF